MKTVPSLILSILITSSGLFAQENPYSARREKLFDIIGEDIALVKNSGRDYVLPMNINWNFYYLTGDTTEDAILVLNGKDKSGYIFGDESPDNKNTANGLNYKPFDQLANHILEITKDSENLLIDSSAKIKLSDYGIEDKKQTKSINLRSILHYMRSIKDESEMKNLTHAIKTTAEGLVEVMKAAEPGMNEKDFENILLQKFEEAGCEHLGFGIQAASGPNGTSVHYGANDRDTEDGDMMVFDVGARSEFYSADISRSFPVNGKFTKEQREIYQLVLDAQKAAIAEMVPGVNIGIASQAARDVLNQGLAELGLITDLESQWQKRFWIQHGFFHHIGLVVHDPGPYDKDLEPGMIITMEPGLYFPEDYLEKGSSRRLRGVSKKEKEEFLQAVTPVFEKYINIGVRIEDDVYITEDGNRIISVGVPKEINEIEALMKEKSMFNK